MQFVRVTDPQTKHQFDVPEGDPRIGKSLELLNDERYPVWPVIRPAKHYVELGSPQPQKLAGRTASRETGAASAASGEATTEKE